MRLMLAEGADGDWDGLWWLAGGEFAWDGNEARESV